MPGLPLQDSIISKDKFSRELRVQDNSSLRNNLKEEYLLSGRDSKDQFALHSSGEEHVNQNVFSQNDDQFKGNF